MVLERSELIIKDGMAEAFQAAMRERGNPLLARHVGCHSVALGRGVENPDKFILMLEWESLDAHAVAAKTERHAEFRQLIGPFTAGGVMEHFVMD
jgi:quinol monooxygenase YgiN